MNILRTLIEAKVFGLFLVHAEHSDGIVTNIQLFPITDGVVQEQHYMHIDDLALLKQRLESVLKRLA